MLRFIFGASGAGKTTTLIKEIIERSVAEPERNFLILVPDQFTMQTQSDVVRAHPRQGIMNIEVLSFSRLTHRMFDENGFPRETVLDDQGKSLILRYVAERHRKDLPVLGAGMHRAGYVDEVKSTLSELMQYDIGPAQLTPLVEAAKSRKALQAKLRDLQTLYAAFKDYISETYMTVEDTLEATAKRVARSALMQDAVVVLDGFTGFTPIQYRLLRAIHLAARELIVSVTVPSETDPYTPDDAEAPGLFALSKKTVHDLTRHMWEAEQGSDPKHTPPFDVWEAARRKTANDIRLPDDPVARLKDAPALAFLERNLFRYGKAVFPAEKAQGAVTLAVSSTVPEEVRQTFRRIRVLLREDASLQYRDFAIVCATPEEYEDEITRSARDFGIPVYQDKAGSIRLNPLIEYLRSVTEIIRTGFSPRAMSHYFRCGLAPYDRADVDYLENYMRASGVRGRKAWENTFVRSYADGVRRTDEAERTLFERVEALRSGFAKRIAPLLRAIDEHADVRGMTRALYTMLTEDGVPERIDEARARFAEAGDGVRASEYAQITKKITALFERVAALLGTETLSFPEYADVLEAGFSEITVGTIPQSADRVTVGDLRRTRLKNVKYLFLLGACDKALPARADAGGLLSEPDRNFLRAAVPGIELAPTPGEQMHIERLYLYMNLTKPSRGICLSYARLDAARKSVRPSYLSELAEQMFPGIRTETAEADDLLEQAETARDTDRRLAAEIRAYADGVLTEQAEKLFLSVYRKRVKDRAAVGRLPAYAFLHAEEKRLPPELAHGLYDSIAGNSVSRLEAFAGCAYAHFAAYGLRLAEQREYDFNAADLGNVYHGVLEAFTRKLAEKNTKWTSFTDEEGEALLDEALRDFTAAYGSAILYDTPRMKRTLLRIRRVLLRTIRTLRYQLQRGGFDPAYTEKPFSDTVGSGAGAMRLYGRIDRVDLAGDDTHEYVKVVDFKSGHYDFDVTRMYHGLQLQLLMYMDAMLAERRKQAGKKEVVPAAMLYYRVSDPVINTDRVEDADNLPDARIDGMIRQELRTTGIVNADERVLDLLDREMAGASDVIPVGKTKSGALTAASSVFDDAGYDTIAAHMKRTVRRIYDKMTEGAIDTDPYFTDKDHTACTWCPYGSLCGFDPAIPGCAYRVLRPMKMEEALQKMREEENGT